MLKKTPLNEIQQELGAKMVDFGGWEMPVQYLGIRQEHQAVRQGVGLFDISHMGELVVSGPGAREAVQYLTCNDLNKLSEGKCQYSAFLTPDGTFVDDIIVYPMAPDHLFICVNAANTDKDYRWVAEHLPPQVGVRDESSRWCQLAVQGPAASAVVQKLTDIKLGEIPRFGYREVGLVGVSTLLSRTGYTGEDGFEIYGASDDAKTLWQAVMEAGRAFDIMPCGLGARDTLRLEACYPLYGHEIAASVNPFEADLAWIVSSEKEDFIGKAALKRLKQSAANRQLIAFKMDERHIPREAYPVLIDGKEAGRVVSGTYSPSLERGIGLAYLAPQYSRPSGKIDIDIRGKKRKATIVPRPFYRAP